MAKAQAQLNFLHMAPRKVRAIAGLIRGRSLNEAEAELLLQRRRAAKPLLKLLRSAAANASLKKLDSAKLVISEIRVDQGPIMKRFLPRARGMASPIQKKMSNITIILSESESIRGAKFTIIHKKKTKVGSHTHKKPEKNQGEEGRGEAEVKKPQKDKGFFKRMFRRKSV